MTTLVVFLIIILGSLVVTFYARAHRQSNTLSEFFVANRSFVSFLFFFLAVGEIYSIGTLVGFPGGIYAGGATYAVWFMGYILLAYPIGFFINPLIWRIAKRYKSETGPDFFQSHWNSKGLGLLMSVSGLIFIIPWGQLQFAGLEEVLHAFKFYLSPSLALTIAGALCLAYILVSGMRAVAMVAVVKDVFMVAAIVIIGVAALSAAHGSQPIFSHLVTSSKTAVAVPASETLFVLSTIVVQAMGFYASPFGMQYVFTAKSSRAVAKAQIFMPLYMLMYVFLVVAAFFAALHIPGLAKNPDFAIFAVSEHLLPGWVQGIIAAGAALSGLMVLTGLSLTVSAIVSKNVVRQWINPRATDVQVRRWAEMVVAGYLLLDLLLTVIAPHLMLNLINTAYYGFTQFFPAILAALFWRRATAVGVGTGLVVGDLVALTLYFLHVSPGGLNLGLIALVANFIVMIGMSLITPRRHGSTSGEPLKIG